MPKKNICPHIIMEPYQNGWKPIEKKSVGEFQFHKNSRKQIKFRFYNIYLQTICTQFLAKNNKDCNQLRNINS